MSDGEKNMMKDYIQLAIQESIGQQSNHLTQLFNRKVQQKKFEERKDELKDLKKEIDQMIQNKIKEVDDKNQLKLPENRDTITQELLQEIEEDKKNLLLEVINEQKEAQAKPKIRTNIIQSEIFNDDGTLNSVRNIEMIKEKIEESKPPLENQSLLQISKIRKNFWTQDYKKFDTKKLFHFFEMLKNYNFFIQFKESDLENIQGALLLTLHSDDRYMNEFIFSDYFNYFMLKFTDQFQTDFEAEIDSSILFTSPHLVLICSFNPKLCHYLDQKLFFEGIIQYIDEIREENYQVFLKAIINIIKNYPQCIHKMISLNILTKFCTKMLVKVQIVQTTLFFVLLNNLKRCQISPKQIFNTDQLNLILQSVVDFFEQNDELRIFSHKLRYNRSSFKTENVSDQQMVNELYKKQYHEFITEKITLKKYDQINFIAISILRFFSENFKLVEDHYLKQIIVEKIFDLVFIFYYQNSSLKFGLKALMKIIDRKLLTRYRDEFFTTEFFHNIFITIKRVPLNLTTLEVMENFQKLILMFLETLQLQETVLPIKNLKIILDYVYLIQKTIDNFFIDFKVRYLNKSLLKYIQKINLLENKNLIQKIEFIASQNTLLLQKISHTHDLDTNINFMQMNLIENSFIKGGNFKQKKEIQNYLLESLKILHIVSKVDRKSGYIFKIDELITDTLKKMDQYIDKLLAENESVDFNIAYGILKYQIQVLLYLKQNDEDLEKNYSKQTLQNQVSLIIKIFKHAKSLIDMTRNDNIYLMFEIFNLFSHLIYNYNLKFQDQQAYLFFRYLDHDISHSKVFKGLLNDDQIFCMLDFSSSLAEVKQKCVFINFMIIKILDFILTQVGISEINKKFLVNTVKKIFDFKYEKEIHNVDPKFLMNYSEELLGQEEINQSFRKFIVQNDLYFNEFICNQLKKILSKNYQFQDFQDKPSLVKILKFNIKQQIPEESSDIIHLMFQKAQENISYKNLFQDIIHNIKKYFQKEPTQENKNLVIQLFSTTNIFEKLIKLYKKSKVNLAKVLKYLLIILQNYNLYTEIEIPERLINGILKTENVEEFQDVYIYLFNYILERQQYGDYKESIDQYFVSTKKFLDDFLFFSKPLDYEKKLKSIYYSLKNLNQVQLLAPESLNLEVNEFILKYIFQLFDENYKLEISSVNNIYQYFNKYFSDKRENQFTKYEKKIAKIILDILKSQKIEETHNDFFVVNKLLSFCFYILDTYPIDMYKDLYFEFILFGLNWEKENPFKQNFKDFYLILFYNFNLQHQKIAELIAPYIGEASAEEKFQVNITEFKNSVKAFETININVQIRACLKIYYLIKIDSKRLSNNSFKMLMKVLNNIFTDNYEQIHEIPRYEKLLIELYMLINYIKKAKSVNTANIFLNIFQRENDFKINQQIDKYIYMGLFNNFFCKFEKKTFYQIDSFQIEKIKNKDNLQELEEKYKKLQINQKQIQEIVTQIELGDIAQPKELILHEFLRNIYFFRKSVILNIIFNDKIIDMLIKQISESIENLKNSDEVNDKDQKILNFRIVFLTYAVKKFVRDSSIPYDQKLKNYKKLFALFDDIKPKVTEILNDKQKNFKASSFAEVIIKFTNQLFLFDQNLNLNDKKIEILEFYDSILTLFSVENIEDKKQQTIFFLISHFVCFMVSNIYDQFRLEQQQTLIEKILFTLESSELKAFVDNLNQEQKKEQENPDQNDKQEENVVVSSDSDDEAKKNQVLEAEIYKFNKEMNFKSCLQNVYFIFLKLSQNYFVLDLKKKKQLFRRIENYQDTMFQFIFFRFITEQLIKYYTKNIPIGNLQAGEQKQQKLQNVLYVHKLLETIQKNLQVNQEIAPKEVDFLNFALKGLKLQIDENVDKQIYNELKIFDILSQIFLNDCIEEKEKLLIMEIIKQYLENTEDQNKIAPEVFENFFYFHETLIFDNFQECVKPFYILLELILEYVPLEKEFVNKFFDKLTYSLFKTKNEIKESIFISAIFVFAKIFRLYEVNYNLEKLILTIYNFLKINHKTMKLHEKGAFAEVIVTLKQRTSMDQIKLENMIYFVNLQFQNDSIQPVLRVIQSLANINEISNQNQSVIKMLGFELLFKMIIKKFGGNIKVAQPCAQLYLAYTNTYELKGKQHREQIEMYQTIKNLLDYIDYYYTIEQRDLVLVYYKCLSNACMTKANADYLIQNRIQNVLCKCYYKNDYEFYFILTSLLVNISYIFETKEQNFSNLYDSKLIQKLSEIYQESIEKQWIEITGNIFDLFIILIEQEFYDIFNQQFLHQIKLTINIYYNNPKVLLRFLTILKNLSLVKIPHVLQMLRQNFDAIFLYHIHFRYFDDQLINSLVKHLIFNIMIREQKNAKEKDLLLFGIPENIVHTFSLDDTSDTMLVNLKIIHFSLKFEKCMIFIRNHFLVTLQRILFGREDNISVNSRETALKILRAIIIHYKGAELIKSYFFFNDIIKLFDLLSIYMNNEQLIETLLQVIKSLLKHDRTSVVKITESHQKALKMIIEKRDSIQNKDVLTHIFDINNLIFVQNEVMTQKYEMFDFKSDISAADKMRLDHGEIIDVQFGEKFYQNCKLRYDFISQHFTISGINFYDTILEKESFGIRFQGQHIQRIDHFDTYELDKFQQNFKTYFEKELPRNLFMSLKFIVYLANSYELRQIYLIFKNEFQKSQWKELFSKLKNELYKQQL